MSLETAYLRAILALIARKNLPPDELAKLVAPRGKGEKQRKAYNLCDGTRPPSDIAKLSGIDASNLSKTFKRWEAQGILVKADYPVHLYALPEDDE